MWGRAVSSTVWRGSLHAMSASREAPQSEGALKIQAFSLGSLSLHIYSRSLALYICCLSLLSTVAWLWPTQIHAGGAHHKESEANGQPRSCGLAVQPGIFDGSEGASGGGPGECPGGRQGSAQAVRQDPGGRSSCQSWSHGCNCL